MKDNLLFVSFLIIFGNLGIYVFYVPAFFVFNVCLVTFFVWFYFKERSLKKELSDYKAINTRKIELYKNESDRNEIQMQLLVASIPSPIALIDSRGVIVIMNPSFKRFVKVLNENTIYLYNDPRIDTDITYFLKQAFQATEPFLMRIIWQGIDFQANCVPFVSENNITGHLVFFQDITKALSGEKMQKQFIADASHELKTPVSALKGMLEILNRPDFDDEETLKEFLEQMSKEAKRVENLINDLLETSKLAADNLVLEKTYVDLSLVVKAVIKSLTPLYEEHQLKIVNTFNFNQPFLCDVEKMYTVFNNLILNAIQYTDKGVINISSEYNNKVLTIKVSDTGVGIAKDKLPHIFERFYRSDRSRSRNIGGSGLGLAIVKGIVDAHEGSIEVNSVLKKGTTFIIKLTNS